MAKQLPVPDARSRPLGVSVLRWLAVGAVLYGGAGFVHLAGSYVVRALRHPGGMFPLRLYDLNVAALVVAACCWLVGGAALLAGRAFAPIVMKVAAGLWLAAMAVSFLQLGVGAFLRSPDAWYLRAYGVVSHLAYYTTNCFFAIAVLLALRHPEIRATFVQPAGGFCPILDSQEHAA